MKPTDFPVEVFGHLASRLFGRATEEHLAARAAAKERDEALQHGHAEAAFACAIAARELDAAINHAIGILDRKAAQEADPHTWPIQRLANLDDETNRHRDERVRQQHPIWGVPGECSGEDVFVGIQPSSREGEVLLFQLNDSDGSIPADFLSIDIENWRALNRFVERIAAGKSIPYDTLGNTHIPAPYRKP